MMGVKNVLPCSGLLASSGMLLLQMFLHMVLMMAVVSGGQQAESGRCFLHDRPGAIHSANSCDRLAMLKHRIILFLSDRPRPLKYL